MHFCCWTVVLLSPLHLNERRPGIFLFSASKRCLHTCMITMAPPCPYASRLNPPSVLESTECLWRCDSPTTTGPKKKPLKYTVKKMLVSNKLKQSSFGRRMWGGSNGTRSPGLPRGGQHFCKWWKCKWWCFFYKASHSANQAPDSRGQVSKIWVEVTSAYLVGYAGKGGTLIDHYIYLGDGFSPTILHEAWKLFLPEGT